MKSQATVKFDVSSTRISPQDQEQLKQLAETAKGVDGYIVKVMVATPSRRGLTTVIFDSCS